jgi:hypothetical protein
MVKWLVIAGVALVVFWVWQNNSLGPAGTPKKTLGTTTNSGFGVSVGSGGISVNW